MLASLLLLALVAACAASKPTSALDDLVVDWRINAYRFYSDADALVRETTLLKNHPGWPMMARIITAEASLKYLEGSTVAGRKTDQALREWSDHWDSPGEEIYTRYRSLVERSRVMYERGQKLIREWNNVHTALIDNADSLPKLEAYERFDRLVKARLSAYSLDAMDLLRRDDP